MGKLESHTSQELAWRSRLQRHAARPTAGLRYQCQLCLYKNLMAAFRRRSAAQDMTLTAALPDQSLHRAQIVPRAGESTHRFPVTLGHVAPHLAVTVVEHAPRAAMHVEGPFLFMVFAARASLMGERVPYNAHIGELQSAKLRQNMKFRWTKATL